MFYLCPASQTLWKYLKTRTVRNSCGRRGILLHFAHERSWKLKQELSVNTVKVEWKITVSFCLIFLASNLQKKLKSIWDIIIYVCEALHL